MKNNEDTPIPDREILRAKINLETARIAWRDLQRFFASGRVYQLDAELDLTEVASELSEDNSAYVQELLDAQKLLPVSDATALRWIESDAEVWAVVVRPFVLVQES